MITWKQLRDEYKSSAHLRFMINAIPLILLIYIATLLFEKIEAYEVSQESLEKKLVKLEVLKKTANWPQVLKMEQSKTELLESELWKSESLELGAADIQAALNELFRHRVEGLRVTLSQPEWLEPAEAWLVTVEVGGKLAENQLQPLLLEIKLLRPTLHLEQFSYTSGRNNLINLHFAALLLITEKGLQPQTLEAL